MKDLNGEKIMGRFYEKELLLSKVWLSYCPDPDIHARNKIKVELNLSNYATKKIGTYYILQKLIHLI